MWMSLAISTLVSLVNGSVPTGFGPWPWYFLAPGKVRQAVDQRVEAGGHGAFRPWPPPAGGGYCGHENISSSSAAATAQRCGSQISNRSVPPTITTSRSRPAWARRSSGTSTRPERSIGLSDVPAPSQR